MSPRSSRLLPPLIGLVTCIAVLVCGGLLASDWVKQSTEMRSLVAQIQVSERAMDDTKEAVDEAVRGFESKAPLSTEDSAALRELLTDAASTGLAEVTRAGALVASVQTLPWHGDVRAAQAAYLAHNQSWQAYLAAAVKDPVEFAHDQPAVSSSFAAAERPLREAVPIPDLFALQQVLDQVFAPPAADPASTQSA